MKKIRYAAAASLAAVCSALPLYSSAAVEINTEPVAKEASVSGFSLSAPKFDIADTLESGEIVMKPATGSIGGYSAMKRGVEDLPESFDLRSINCMTPVKNQGAYGTCWAHSAVASGESSIKRYNPDVDLSELHTSYYTFYGDDQISFDGSVVDILEFGGTSFMALNLWSQWIGPVFESRLPYDELSFFKDEEAVAELKFQSDYHLKNAYLFDYNKERSNADEVNHIIKELVYSGLAVDVSFQSDSEKYYSDVYNSTRSVRRPKYASHSVAIAGWDDNFPKENFKVPAENDGAWLIKNSWGEDEFDEGYMWISYDDTSLCEFAAFELEDAENYKYNYHHDTYVPLQSMSAADDRNVNEPSYMANIFTAEEDMQLEAILVNIPCSATEYEITIYSGLTDETDPTSGQASAVTKGVVDLSGTVTIELDEDVIVEEGERFSAVMKLYCAESPYVIPIESVLYIHGGYADEIIPLGTYTTYDGIKSNTGVNESFCSSDGTEWLDIAGNDMTYNDEEKAEILKQLEEQLFEDIYPEETDLLEEAEIIYSFYEESFNNCDLSIAIGNVAMKVLANPINTVDFSHMTGYIPTGERIELSVKNGSTVYYSINGSEYTEYTEPLELNGYSYVSATVDFESYTERSYIAADFIVENGDVNADGAVDSSDASMVLSHYADISTGGAGIIKKAIYDYSDMNGDKSVDSSDASRILEIYAERSTK
ncbi:MAG: hypothetical protein J6A57_06850 [Ruminococcus sp.]|nr:hypothetical protein [Ruminococcus sp.]